MQTWDKWTDAETVTAEALVDHWEDLIYWMANRARRSYHLDTESRDDIAQSMILELLAMPASKRPYIGYARMVLNNSLRDAVALIVSRGARPHKIWNTNATTDYESAVAGHNPDDDVLYALDYLRNTEHSGKHETTLVNAITLDAALEGLTARERLCVDVERNSESIAEEMGCSKQRVSQIRRLALTKLKKILNRRK